MLEIKNLVVETSGKRILNGVNLTLEDGCVAAIMGPNGSGKSTLSYVLSGKPEYTVLDGEVLFNGQNLLELDVDARAQLGLFLAFQYPIEIPGVSTMTFIKAILAAKQQALGLPELKTSEWISHVYQVAERFGISKDMLKRGVNVGFSGGEKKRMEMVQMALLEPKCCLLDETDSGLDIDALRVVADGVNQLRSSQRSFLIITHYQRLLNYIVPDVIHIMVDGRIEKTGGKELAFQLEESGYANFQTRSAEG